MLGVGMDLAYWGFLNQEIDFEGKCYGWANYSIIEGWFFNMGLMYGLIDGVEVQFFLKDGVVVDCKIGEVMDVSSMLNIDFEQCSVLDKKNSY